MNTPDYKLESRRLNTILDQALEMEPEHRIPFITKACGSDESLRERALKIITRCTTPPPDDFLKPSPHIRKVTEAMAQRLSQRNQYPGQEAGKSYRPEHRSF